MSARAGGAGSFFAQEEDEHELPWTLTVQWTALAAAMPDGPNESHPAGGYGG